MQFDEGMWKSLRGIVRLVDEACLFALFENEDAEVKTTPLKDLHDLLSSLEDNDFSFLQGNIIELSHHVALRSSTLILSSPRYLTYPVPVF